jgi:hypothetical protein
MGKVEGISASPVADSPETSPLGLPPKGLVEAGGMDCKIPGEVSVRKGIAKQKGQLSCPFLALSG